MNTHWAAIKSPGNVPSVMALYFVSWLKVNGALTETNLQLTILRNIARVQPGPPQIFYFELIASALLCLKEQSLLKDSSSSEKIIWRSVALHKLPSLISLLEKERLNLGNPIKQDGQEFNPVELMLSQLNQFPYLCQTEKTDTSETVFENLGQFFIHEQLITSPLMKTNFKEPEQFQIGDKRYESLAAFTSTLKPTLTNPQVENILRHILVSTKHQMILSNIIIEGFKTVIQKKNHKALNEILTSLFRSPDSFNVIFLYTPISTFLKHLFNFLHMAEPKACKIPFPYSLGTIFSTSIFLIERFKLNSKLSSLIPNSDPFLCGWVYSIFSDSHSSHTGNILNYIQLITQGSGVEALLNKITSPQEMCFLIYNALSSILKAENFSDTLHNVVASLISLFTGSLSFVAVVVLKKLSNSFSEDINFIPRYSSLITSLEQQPGLPNSVLKLLGPHGLKIFSKRTDYIPQSNPSTNENNDQFHHNWECSIESTLERAYFKFIQGGMVLDNLKYKRDYTFSDAVCDITTALEFLDVIIFTRFVVQIINKYPGSLLRAAELSTCLLAIPLAGPSSRFPDPCRLMSAFWNVTLSDYLLAFDKPHSDHEAVRAIGYLASWTLLICSSPIDAAMKSSIYSLLHQLSFCEDKSDDTALLEIFDYKSEVDMNLKFTERIERLGPDLYYDFSSTPVMDTSDFTATFNGAVFDRDAPITPSSSPLLTGIPRQARQFSVKRAFLEGFLISDHIYNRLESLNN